MESAPLPAALLLPPGPCPGTTWWDTAIRLATRQHVHVETLVRDVAELMRLIWDPDTPEQVGVVATRAVLPPEPLIVLDELTADRGRPRWVQRRRW